MGGAVCSVAAGHGRNWGQGAVTGCYGQLLLGTREIQSKVTPLLEIKSNDGKSSLDEGIMPLTRPPVDRQGAILFYNAGDSPLSFSWRADPAEWNELTLNPGETKDILL